MISIRVYHSLSILSTQYSHYPVACSESFGPLGHGRNLVHNESLQISFCQTSLGKDLTSCFMMISMSVVQFSN